MSAIPRTLLLVMLSLLQLLAASFPTFAADNTTGFYFGAGIGQSAVTIADQDPDFGHFDFDDDDNAWKAFAGFRLLPFLALEGGYRDLGGPQDMSGSLALDAEITGVDAAVLGLLPLGPVDLFARGGVIWWDATLNVHTGPISGDISYDGSDLIYGGGAGVRLGMFGLRGEYEVIDTSDFNDLEMWTVSAVLTF